MKIAIFVMMIIMLSCNNKSNNLGSVISKSEEEIILNEEIDDIYIEREVSTARLNTRNFLNLEKAKQIGLKETYLHEEPLSIIFTLGDDLVQFDAIKVDDSDIESTINSFMSVSNSNLKIEQVSIDGFDINYAEHKYNNRQFIQALINIDDTNQRVSLGVSTIKQVNAENLLKKYLIIKDFKSKK